MFIKQPPALFSVPVAEVNAEQRDIAKTVNFSIVYGISDFGLARDLGISIGKAHDYIAAYDARYQKVREWLNNTIKLAYDQGYVETLLGQKTLCCRTEVFRHKCEELWGTSCGQCSGSRNRCGPDQNCDGTDP